MEKIVFITLHRAFKNNEEIFINVSHISAISEDKEDHCTLIWMQDGSPCSVQESAKDVLDLMLNISNTL